MNKKHKNVVKKNTRDQFLGIIMITKVYAISSSLFTLSHDISNILFR